MTDAAHPPVFIVGAGPAGISAALWLKSFGLSFDWVDPAERVGGLLRRVHNRIENYPGGPFPNGMALAANMQSHIRESGLSPRPLAVESIDPFEGALALTLSDGSVVKPELVMLATGTRYRKLGVPGEEEGLGTFVSQSATADGEDVAGRPVAVVGGGDAGFENALILARLGCQVTLLVRNPIFRARPAHIRAVEEHPGISIAPIPSRVQRIDGTDKGCRLTVDQDGRICTIDVAALFVRIGVEPLLPGGSLILDSDSRGFLKVDQSFRTSHPCLLAIGDIISSPLRSVATAVGHGAAAAQICAAQLDYL